MAEDPAWNFLERLCNLAAVEFLFPYDAFLSDMDDRGYVDLEKLFTLAQKYEASLEATARRLVSLCSKPLALGVFSKKHKPAELQGSGQGLLFEIASPKERLRVDYCVPNSGFKFYLPEYKSVPDDSPLIKVYEEGTQYIGVVSIELKSQTVIFQTQAFRSNDVVLTLLKPHTY